jgi:hypothetical protein
MPTWVTPKKLETSSAVVRYHFVRAPLVHELGRLFSEREPLYLRVITMAHEGGIIPVKMDLVVLPSQRYFKRYGPCTLMGGSVVAAHSADSQRTPCTWPDKNTELEIAFYASKVDRRGFFILAGGGYTMFKDD